MIKPNFFIPGAPKCGTSSMWEYLSEHPNVFMSTPKEPYFWAPDFSKSVEVNCEKKWRFSDYSKLFEDASEKHKVVGEASATYLASDSGVSHIMQFNPDAKFVVMLRNPIELVISWYRDRIYYLDEDQNIETAWRLQEMRAHGKDLPTKCLSPQGLQYRWVASLGTQLERLLLQVPREQVLPVLLEDLIQDPRNIYLKVLGFLDLLDDGRKDFSAKNVSKTHRFPAISKFIMRPPSILMNPLYRLRRDESFSKLTVLAKRLIHGRPLNVDLSVRFRLQLLGEFKPEIQKLERVLKRDLSHWR